MPLIGLMGLSGSGKDTVAQILASRHLVEGLDGGAKGEYTDVLGVTGGRHPALAPPLVPHGVQLSLADDLKAFCHRVYDFSIETLWGESSKRNAPDPRWPQEHSFLDGQMSCQHCGLDLGSVGPKARRDLDELRPCGFLTAREALQKLGTEWGRALHQDTWTRALLARARALLGRPRVKRPDLETAHTFAPNWYLDRTDLVVVSDVRFLNEVLAIQAAGGAVWQVVRPEAPRTLSEVDLSTEFDFPAPAGANGNGDIFSPHDNGRVDGARLLRAAHSSEIEQMTAEIQGHIDLRLYNNASFATLTAQVRAGLERVLPQQALTAHSGFIAPTKASALAV